MEPIDLKFLIEFLPSQHGEIVDAIAQTGDFLTSLVMFCIVLASLSLLLFLTVRLFRKLPVSYKYIHAAHFNYNSIKNEKILLIISLLIFCLSLGCFVSQKAFAESSKSNLLPEKITAYVDEDTGEITFDTAIMTNDRDYSFSIGQTVVSQTSDVSGISGLNQSTFYMAGLGKTIYEQTPDKYGDDPVPYIIEGGTNILGVNESAALSFDLYGLDAHDAKMLIGKNVFELHLYLNPRYIHTEFNATDGTFKDGSKTKIIDEEVEKNYVLPSPSPGYDNFHFEGWFTQPGGQGDQITSTTLVNDLSVTNIYAYWEPNVYSITLDSNGGTGGTNKIYQKYGDNFYLDEQCTQTITSIDLPEKSGYSFDAYYDVATPIINKEGNILVDAFYFSSNKEIRANWNANVYSITLDSQGATPETTTIYQKFQVGFFSDEACTQEITSVAIPEKAGLVFEGYWEDSQYTKLIIDKNGSIQVAPSYFEDDKTIIAKWVGGVYKINLDQNCPSTNVDPTETIYEKYGDGFYFDEDCTQAVDTIVVPEQTGYTFDGYWENNQYTKEIIDETGTLKVDANYFTAEATIVGKWNANIYKVTLNPNTPTSNVEPTGAIYEKYGVGFYFDEDCTQAVTTVVVPEQTGYTFDGYWDSTQYTTQIIDETGTLKVDANCFTAEAIIVGKWSPCVYKITLIPNYPSSNADPTDAIYEKYGDNFYFDEECTQAVDAIVVPEQTGYTFEGYFEITTKIIDSNGSLLVNAKHFSSAAEIFATWKANVYEITLNPNISENEDPTTTLYEKYGDGFYFDEACSNKFTSTNPIVKPQWDSHNFVGYFDSEDNEVIDLNGKPAQDLKPTYTTDSTITWTAKWVEENVYVINLNQNGGTGGTEIIYEKFGDAFYSDSSCTTLVTKVNIPSKTGYSFDGYFEDTTEIIDNEGNISVDADHFSANTEITASWTANVYEISLNPNIPENEDPTLKIYEKYDDAYYSDAACTSKITSVIVPSKTHYIFDGYFKGATKIIDTNGTILETAKYFSEDTEISASWTVCVYEITLNNLGGSSETSKIYEKYGDDFYSDALCTQAITSVDVPEKIGNTFEGYWDSDQYEEQVIDKDGKLKVDASYFESNFTIIAKWEASVYKFTLNPNYPTSNNDPTDAIYQKYNDGFYFEEDCINKFDSNNPIVIPEYDDYSFLGYFDANNNKYIDEFGKPSATLLPTFESEDEWKAQWQETKVYTITLNKDGGTEGYDKIYEKYGIAFYSDEACEHKISKDFPVELPVKYGWRFFGYKQNSVDIIDEDGFMKVDPNYFNADSTINALWQNDVFKINLNPLFPENNESYTTEIYEKYNVGFFFDAACTSPFDASHPISIPQYEHHVLLGYYYTESELLIDGEGKPTDKLTSTLVVADQTWYASWDFAVYEIKLMKDKEDPKEFGTFWEKYSVGFFSSPTCTEDKRITTVSNLPVRDEYICSGLYDMREGYNNTQITKGVESTPLESGKFLVDFDYFDEDCSIVAWWRFNLEGTLTLNHFIGGIDTKRNDDVKDKIVHVSYTSPLDGQYVDDEVVTDNDGKFSTHLPDSKTTYDVKVWFNWLGYYAEQSQTVGESGTVTYSLTASLNFDNYEFYELEEVGNAIATGKSSQKGSKFDIEFNYYISSSKVWYSHSCSKFDPHNPDISVLDPKYKNNFDVEQGSEQAAQEINQYLFLRIIDFNHDSLESFYKNAKAGITLQAVHCLPKLYAFDSNGTQQVFWEFSELRSNLNNEDNSVYTQLSEYIKPYLQKISKFTLDYTYDGKATDDYIFPLSYQEMTCDGSFKDFGQYSEKYSDGSEGTRYDWYTKIHIYGDRDNDKNDRFMDLGKLNSGGSLSESNYRWLRSPSEIEGELKTKYINQNGAYYENFDSNTPMCITPAFCVGSTQDYFSGKLTLDPGETGRVDSPSGQTINYYYEHPDTHEEVFSRVITDDDGAFYIDDLPKSKEPYTVSVEFNWMGYYEKQQVENTGRGLVGVDLNAGLALDNYKLEELNTVATDIYNNSLTATTSVYQKEFESYIDEDAIWYSHSCGSYDEDDPTDISGLDDNYMNNFTTSSEEESKPVNQFIFLRVIDICHDQLVDSQSNADSGKAGLTFQTVHRLPNRYIINEQSENNIWWGNSQLRNSMIGGEIFDGFNPTFLKYMQKVKKTSQSQHSAVPQEGSVQTTEDKLFTLSYQEMCTQGTEDTNFPSWYSDGSEGTQYSWYSKQEISGNDGNNQLVYLGMLNSQNYGNYCNLWERSVGCGNKDVEDDYPYRWVSINNTAATKGKINQNKLNYYNNQFGINPCFCFGGNQATEDKSQIYGSLILDAGSTGRTDTDRVASQIVKYSYEDQDGNLVSGSVLTNGRGEYLIDNLPVKGNSYSVSISCEAGYGYYAETSVTISRASIYRRNLVATLALDNYTLEELHYVAGDISDKEHSPSGESQYYNEFNSYLNNGTIWYSHSLRKYNPNTPNDVRYLDKNYKNSFRIDTEAYPGADAEVNQYFFLRIIGIRQDNLSNGTGKHAGLTFQCIHCLPRLYLYDSDEPDAEKWWGSNNTLRTKMNSGSIYTALNNNYKNYIVSVDKNTQSLHNPSTLSINQTSDKLFVLTPSEIAKSGSLPASLGIWSQQSAEGSQYSWYNKFDFPYNAFNDQRIFDLFKCNNGYDFQTYYSQGYIRSWLRSPFPGISPDFNKFSTFSYTNSGSEIASLEFADISSSNWLVNPCFCF